MGLSTSFGQLAAKLDAFSVGVPTACQSATVPAAAAMKTTILGVAAARKQLPGDEKWVSTKILPGASFSAALRGGFAHLTEKGSYKKPSGWQINAYNNASGVLASADGEWFRPSAIHKAIKARPFWHEGVAAGLPVVKEAYENAVHTTLNRIF